MSTSSDVLPLRLVIHMGALLGILVAGAAASGVSAMTAPFSATVALLAVLPQAPFSRPRTVILSHVACVGVGALMALLGGSFGGPVLLAAFIGAWVSIAVMAGLRVLHAPAVAHTVILALGKQQLGRYMVVSLLMSCILAAAAALALRRTAIAPAGASPAR